MSPLTPSVTCLLGLLTAACAVWLHERGHVKAVTHFNLSQSILYHLHIPKAAGTTIKDLFPARLRGVRLCDAFAQKLYSNVDKFEAAAAALARQAALPCNFVSVEGDFEAAQLLGARAVTFVMLRDPLELLVSQWRHDIKKGKFAAVADKYNVSRLAFDAHDQHLLGFDHNMQTLRIGAGVVERAMERLHAAQFGLVEHFHASVCLLLFAAGELDQFRASCACDTSPLSQDHADNVARPETQASVVSLELLLGAWRNHTPDRRLYSYAHELFLQRVQFVERETRVRLVCTERRDDLTEFVRPLLHRQQFRESLFHHHAG